MKTILALTDFSHKSIHAAEYGLHLAEHLKADLCLFNTYTEPDGGSGLFSPEKDNQKEVKEHLSEAAARFDRESRENAFLLYHPQVTYTAKQGEISDLGESIAEIAEEKSIGLIIMGAKGDECLSNFIPGTETYSVIQNAKCPVLFVPEEARFNKIRKMALITDEGSFDEQDLLSLLNEFQEHFNTEILFTKMNSMMHIIGSEYSYGTHFFSLKSPVRSVDEYELGDQLQEVSGKTHIDVLAVMFHKEHLFERIFHSSTSKLLMYNVNLPLLVFPAN